MDRSDRIDYEIMRALVAAGWDQSSATPPFRRDGWTLPWEQAIWPPYGESVPPSHPVEPPIPQYEWDGELRFQCPMPSAPWVLVFSDRACAQTHIAPVRRVYVVLNTAELIRVSDGANIPAQQIGLSIDSGSWAWDLQATLAGADALDLVRESGGNARRGRGPH